MRLGLAGVLPGVLAEPGLLALAIVAVAAATDFVDGPLARRAASPSRWGGVLDNLADIAFVLTGTAAAAAAGAITWAAPLAIAAAAAAYAVDSVRTTRRAGRPRLAPSAIGHAAGVGNWVLVALVAGAAWPSVVALASGGVVALNLAAVLARLVSRRALATPAAGTPARSARSSP